MNVSIALILRSLAGAVAMPGIFGDRAAKLAPVLDTVAALAEVPEALEPQRRALLELVQTWVDQKREPTDAELDLFRSQRNELDAQLKAARDALSQQ